MNTVKARRLLWQTKKNIGILLTGIRQAGSGEPQTEARRFLGANVSQLYKLLRMPELASEKVRQMKLNI
jgi:hypothetical protein